MEKQQKHLISILKGLALILAFLGKMIPQFCMICGISFQKPRGEMWKKQS